MSPIQRSAAGSMSSSLAMSPTSQKDANGKHNLIHPMNPLGYRKIHLHSKHSQVTSKVGERFSSTAPASTTASSPQSGSQYSSAFGDVVSSLHVSPTSPKHISGDLLNTGDTDFLRIRGRHVDKVHYVTEVKDHFRYQKPAMPKQVPALIDQSGFTMGNKVGTSPWRHLLKQ